MVSTNLVDLLIFATMYAVNSASTSDEQKSSKAQLGLAAFKAAFAACAAWRESLTALIAILALRMAAIRASCAVVEA